MALFRIGLRSALAVTMVIVSAALPAATVGASPIDDPHVGGLGFSGPTAADLSSIYWNPAAVGLVVGNQALVAGTGRFTALGLARASIDPSSGRPGPGRPFPSVGGRSDLRPSPWLLGPGGFLGLSAALGSRFALAIGAFMPFSERIHWSAAADGSSPARYHAVDIALDNLALVPALSIYLGGGVRIGAAPGLLFSTGRVIVDQDTALGASPSCGGEPCGPENPAAAARYDVSSGLSPFDSSLSFTLGFGLLIDRPGWRVGIGFVSRPIGVNDGVQIEGRNTVVTPPTTSAAGPSLCPPDRPSCLAARAVYRLPTTLTVGFDRQLGPRFRLGVSARWLDLSVHDAIRVRVSGPADGGLRSANLPEDLVLHRGFRDVVDGRLRLGWQPGARIELAALCRVESSAVPRASISPAAVDGWKLEPGLAARVRVADWLSLSAGYAFTYMIPVEVHGSIFDPTAGATCAASGGDLASLACQKRRDGEAMPTAAGRYTAHTQTLSLTVAATL